MKLKGGHYVFPFFGLDYNPTLYNTSSNGIISVTPQS